MWLVAGGLAVFGLGFLAFRVEGQRRPRPMAMRFEQFFLDNPFRKRFFGADQVIRQLGDVKGFTVGEIGTGVGMVVDLLARAVGDEGRVFGVDIQEEAILRTVRRLSRSSLADRATIDQADAANLPWPGLAMDRVVMVAVLGEIPEARQPAVFHEVMRVLKPDGKVLVTELWPDPHYISRSRLLARLMDFGFQIERISGGRMIYHVLASPRSVL